MLRSTQTQSAGFYRKNSEQEDTEKLAVLAGFADCHSTQKATVCISLTLPGLILSYYSSEIDIIYSSLTFAFPI